MAIATTCPNCKALFRLDDEMAGKKVKCQKCAHIFIVPKAGENTVAPAASVSQPPADMQLDPAPPTDVPNPPMVPDEVPEGAVTTDDEPARPTGKREPPPSLGKKSDDRPSKRERRTPSDSGSNASLMAMLVLFGLGGLIVCAGFCGVLGWLFYAIQDEGRPEQPVVKKADGLAKGDGNKGNKAPPPPPPKPPTPKTPVIDVVLGPDGSYRSENSVSAFDAMNRAFKRHKLYAAQFQAGQSYQIDMMTKQFDAYVYLLDNAKKVIQENDDGGEGLNSRIVYKANRTGVHYIEATSRGGRSEGSFTLSVRRLEPMPNR